MIINRKRSVRAGHEKMRKRMQKGMARNFFGGCSSMYLGELCAPSMSTTDRTERKKKYESVMD